MRWSEVGRTTARWRVLTEVPSPTITINFFTQFPVIAERYSLQIFILLVLPLLL